MNQGPAVAARAGKVRALRPRREEIAPGENLCSYCTAKCCHYFALPIDRPSEPEDFDYIRWYLLHDRASVFVEEGTWYLLVHTTCQHLRDDYRCGIYETRPQICRDYTTDECEYDDDWTFEQYFETPEQVVEFVEAIRAKPAKSSFRSPRPNPLAVLP